MKSLENYLREKKIFELFKVEYEHAMTKDEYKMCFRDFLIKYGERTDAIASAFDWEDTHASMFWETHDYAFRKYIMRKQSIMQNENLSNYNSNI